MANFSIANAVEKAFHDHAIIDIHTHLYPPTMGDMYLAGPDELITYHYLKAECSRNLPVGVSVEEFNTMPKPQQADIIWQQLFVGESSPIAEAQIGIVTVMSALGLNPRAKDLSEFRALYASMSREAYVDMVFEKAGVGAVYMTNDPLDASEGPMWQKNVVIDSRFRAVLRLDSALMNWPAPIPKLRALGYEVENDLSDRTLGELRRYLTDWCAKINARYMAISLPPDFTYPSEDSLSQLMASVVYPTAQKLGIPSAMMVGVTRQVNPALRDGGDSLGKWDISNLERIARDWPKVNFLVTLLSRENQHELCVTGRKFPNVHPFGCWWFLNNPSIIREITLERIELLGTSFVPQHSDARILDQLLYKWPHSILVLAPVFTEKYSLLRQAGWPLTREDIHRDIAQMFGGGKLLR
jgi:hypothetical protein